MAHLLVDTAEAPWPGSTEHRGVSRALPWICILFSGASWGLTIRASVCSDTHSLMLSFPGSYQGKGEEQSYLLAII